jgi:hypothetical protein
MTLTSGVTWLFMTDIGKFKPRLDVPSALDVSATRSLKDVKEQILEDGYVESDNYGQHEEGYILFSFLLPLCTDKMLLHFFRKEQRETFQGQLQRVIHQEDDDNDGGEKEKENETENENLQGEEIKIPSFCKNILRPHPSLHKLALSNSFTPLLQLSHFFSTSNLSLVTSLRKQIADETGLSDILMELLRTSYSPTKREILFFSKNAAEHNIDIDTWTTNVDQLKLEE